MLRPLLHIAAAYATYLAVALLASAIIRRIAGDLKDFAVRNSTRVLLLGGAANVLAAGAVLCLLIFLDKRPVSALGIVFRAKDAFAAFGGAAITSLLATGYLALLQGMKKIRSLEFVMAVKTPRQIGGMLVGLAVLATIVLQEEILNRGYVALNAMPLGPWGVILVSTALFVLIHFATNRATVYQVASWVVSGFVLAASYVLSGSIWVPVALHYATDAANTLVFDITGRFSFFKTSPAVTDAQRAAFRVIYGIVMTILLFCIYGPQAGLTG